MTFFDEAYSYEVIGGDEKLFRYSFFSLGEYEITKVISIRAIGGLDGVYNLGFGNLEKNEDGMTFVNDSSKVNNTDFDLVLKTVFTCIFDYLTNVNPKAKVLFFGNTEHKHKIYRRMVARYLDELLEYLSVQGGTLNGNIPLIEQEQVVEKKGKVRTRKVKIKDADAIDTLIAETDLETIDQYVKDFDVNEINNYQFILIKIK